MSKPYAVISEVWKDVVGYEGRYMVSDLGRVKSLPNKARKSELVMKLVKHKKTEHRLVNLTSSVGGFWRQKVFWVHRLVLEAFVGPCPEGMEGCHGDGDPANNVLSNLRWDTHKNNMDDRVTHGTHAIGEQNPRAKLTNAQAKEVKRRIENGESNEEISEDFPITARGIKSIRNGQNWSHL